MEFKTLDYSSFGNYMKEFGDLYSLCFNVPMDEKEVKWRYMGNPAKDILACVALDKGKLIANYSASPIQLYKDDKKVKVALSLNTMTHPDYMGQGLFVRLASAVYNHMAENGYRMILGFPNNISNRTFVTKLGWSDVCTVPTLQIDLNSVKKKPCVCDKEVMEDHEFLLNYDNCFFFGHNISVYKSVEYLRWRYTQNPAMKYYNFVVQQNGMVSSRVIIKEFRDRINIVDSFFASVEEEKLLINRVIDFGQARKKNLLTLWMKLGTEEHLTIESYGAILAAPLTYFGCNVFDKSGDFQDFYCSELWTLNMSDDNVY